MKKAFQIFKRDLKRLLHNPVAMVITIGVCIIPSLYAWYNIEANWDPYSNTSGVKIAVANEDEGVENELTGSLNAGEQTVEQLKENDDLGWVFTDAESAKEGVYSGEYYAAIVIPKDFSEKLTSMLTGDFEQPELTYYVNEKKNAIAPKVTDTGAETIEEQLNETFVATVSSTLVEQAQKLGVDVDAAGERAEQGVLANVSDSVDALQRVREGLGGMATTIDDAKVAATSAKSSLAGMNAETPALVDALDKGHQLLGTTRSAAGEFHTALSTALANGATQLGTASSKADAAVGSMAGAVSAAKTKIDISLSNFQAVIDSNSRALEALRNLNNSALGSNGDIEAFIHDLENQNAGLQSAKDALQTQSDALGQDVDAATTATDAINTAVQGSVENLGKTQQTLNSSVIPQLSAGLDAFSNVSGDLSGVVTSLTPTIAQSMGLLDQLNAMLDQTKSALASSDETLADLQATLETVKTDIVALRSSEATRELANLLDMDPANIADFMSAPVTLTTKAVYPVENYGSGVTPFYTNLALWVGGFVLIAIFKLEVDTEGVGQITANQGYFGRWMLMVLLGFVQSIIVCVGDLVLGIQCSHPVLFVIAGVFTSFVYVNIIYALSIAFKHIGKAIGVILVIVQIPGSSGMYPIEMMPGFFQWLHPLLPFTYGINLLRETVGGMYSFNYLFNLCILGVFLIVALFNGLQLRPLLLNLNLLFDKQLSTTGMMICESNDLPRQRYSLRTAMRVMLDSDSYRRELLDHAVAFEHRYPYYIKGGFAAVVGVQVLLFVLSTVLDIDNNGKIILLVIWIISVIAICGWLINIEYIRASLNTQMRISALSDEDLRREMREHTAAIPAARHMFGLNASERGAKGGDQSTGRLPHIGSHHKSQGSDSTATNDGDTTALGKHSKGGEA